MCVKCLILEISLIMIRNEIFHIFAFWILAASPEPVSNVVAPFGCSENKFTATSRRQSLSSGKAWIFGSSGAGACDAVDTGLGSVVFSWIGILKTESRWMKRIRFNGTSPLRNSG